jgi:hypothetical protein
MDRSNHYEAAFEGWLQSQKLCYVAVDETRRSFLEERSVKSLDFIVYGQYGANLLVDVKGRRYPSGPPEKGRRVWQSWAEREDVDGLSRWAARFGAGYVGLLVFAYHVLPEVELPDDLEDLFCWRGRRYLLRAVDVDEYRRHLRVRSPRWDTVYVPGAIFRYLVQPISHFTRGVPVLPEECPF